MTRAPSQVLAAALTGVIIGVVGGAAIAGSGEGSSWWQGAVVGAVVVGFMSGWADATRTPGQPQPLIVRVLSAAMIAAASGAALEWILPDWSAVIPAALAGGVTGAIGFRIEKVLLGLGLGVAVGFAFDSCGPRWVGPCRLP